MIMTSTELSSVAHGLNVQVDVAAVHNTTTFT